MTGDAPIGLEVLQSALGEAITPPATSPLPALLKIQQAHYLEAAMAEQGLSLDDLSRELELDGPLQSAEALASLPLQSKQVG